MKRQPFSIYYEKFRLGRAGSVYTMGTALLGSYLSYWGAQLAFRQSNRVARRLLFASIIYLPFEFVLMALDKASR